MHAGLCGAVLHTEQERDGQDNFSGGFLCQLQHRQFPGLQIHGRVDSGFEAGWPSGTTLAWPCGMGLCPVRHLQVTSSFIFHVVHDFLKSPDQLCTSPWASNDERSARMKSQSCDAITQREMLLTSELPLLQSQSLDSLPAQGDHDRPGGDACSGVLGFCGGGRLVLPIECGPCRVGVGAGVQLRGSVRPGEF